VGETWGEREVSESWVASSDETWEGVIILLVWLAWRKVVEADLNRYWVVKYLLVVLF